MGKVFSHMTMSLDGFIATPDDGIEDLFEWYEAGDVSVPSANKDISFKVDPKSAEALRGLTGNTGALIAGRRLFDITKGWDDNHPIGAPVVVVTHHPPADAAEKWPKTTFVSGIAEAVERAKEIAGDRDVTISSASIIQQALELGLVDEVCISLAPALLGEGIAYFGKLSRGHVLMEDPEVIVGRRAVHLRYRVRR